jgi:hypothetical protein
MTMAFCIMCTVMLVTCLERSCSIRKCYLRVSSDDLRGGVVQRRDRGVEGALKRAKLFPLEDFAKRDKRQYV